MAVRRVYSCDWCGEDSPTPGFIGPNWQHVAGPIVNGREVVVCYDCFKMAAAAVKEVELARAEVGKTRAKGS